MKKCNYCHVSVSGPGQLCPLCQNPLTDEEQKGTETFPYIPTTYQKHSLFIRSLLFASLLAIILSLFFNHQFPEHGFWAFYVILGIACGWISFFTILRNRNNVIRSIIKEAMVLTVLVLLWDFFTHWHGWSIDYVIPILWTSVMLSVAITSPIIHLKWSDYISYLGMTSFFSILPLIFLWTHQLNTEIPSYICVISGMVCFLGLLIFEGKYLLQESKKRFHF